MGGDTDSRLRAAALDAQERELTRRYDLLRAKVLAELPGDRDSDTVLGDNGEVIACNGLTPTWPAFGGRQ